MGTTTKNLTQLTTGDVIVDPQGQHHRVTEVTRTNDGAWRIVTNTYPEGRLLDPVGAPETVEFHVVFNLQVAPEISLGGVDHSGIAGSELSRVIIAAGSQRYHAVQDDEYWDRVEAARLASMTPEEIAAEEAHDAQMELEADENWPVGSTMLCYQCKPITGVERVCTALGPVTGRADPTQTYKLECGHTAI